MMWIYLFKLSKHIKVINALLLHKKGVQVKMRTTIFTTIYKVH